MLARIHKGESAARRDLRLRLVCERLTHVPYDDRVVNAAMQRGVEKEADARRAYEALTGHLVNETGFIAHDTLMAGCSPDGEHGGFQTLVEIKVPKSATHLSYVRGQHVPSRYLPQLTHQLWVTDAEAVDFFSWDDRLPAGLQTFRATLTRADVDLAGWDRLVRQFLSEVDRELSEVHALTDLVHA